MKRILLAAAVSLGLIAPALAVPHQAPHHAPLGYQHHRNVTHYYGGGNRRYGHWGEHEGWHHGWGHEGWHHGWGERPWWRHHGYYGGGRPGYYWRHEYREHDRFHHYDRDFHHGHFRGGSHLKPNTHPLAHAGSPGQH